MLTLKAYLDQSGEKQVAFAERVSTTPATVSRLCAGTLKPALDLAHRIEAATSGAVPTEVWIASMLADALCAGSPQVVSPDVSSANIGGVL